MSHTSHRTYADAQIHGIHCGVLTISDTRTLDNDTGGQLAQRLLVDGGHHITHYAIVRDEPAQVVAHIEAWVMAGCQMIVTTGGTGIAKRDTTIDAIEPLLACKLPGFGEIFRMLSYQQVGAAAMLSRATAGTIGQTLIFCLPGSPAAVELAMTQLIVPELRHLVWETVRQAPQPNQQEE
ncbi:MAG: MogA/MoaB family molybdenum cofactor biosynthesis protein [Chloroflexia bacterium]|nr:MogA/MoaB family molybdenum cofactor biosynthesis protein [Chloroflexia bacterium]